MPPSFFFHHDAIWAAHPALAVGVLQLAQITPDAQVAEPVARHHALARERLAQGPEGEFPEIQAWRRAFSAMGLKPTQYRCAAESLLRRFRKDDRLPALHPLVDLCNAVSLAFAIPIAVFDLSRIDGGLEVRHARGDETHDSFAGAPEPPDAGEVIFADAAGHAHARRWCHRQSARSCVQASTSDVLVVAEALHAGAADDVARLMAALAGAVQTAGWAVRRQDRLQRAAPRFALAALV
ncbi:DNA/RNA-binding domain of Phe-tRNA-synthetase-like protein [Variovorax sp. TBS-050B]|uniref:B3/B4 domain-containing protein n=1 Tax=Variovorax sp. TBS-050B TaxID=2940551 RepID=UPI0024758727|nr:phenylalanine--tRNA ligase beta subunit-related protein [Variovorax sp. TBS-050B]MDH6590192.1 DNA/RNA-binding domain of Phe-tRNA-synthetase-like protein [Variovorax sp. TBS-050B]